MKTEFISEAFVNAAAEVISKGVKKGASKIGSHLYGDTVGKKLAYGIPAFIAAEIVLDAPWIAVGYAGYKINKRKLFKSGVITQQALNIIDDAEQYYRTESKFCKISGKIKKSGYYKCNIAVLKNIKSKISKLKSECGKSHFPQKCSYIVNNQLVSIDKRIVENMEKYRKLTAKGN